MRTVIRPVDCISEEHVANAKRARIGVQMRSSRNAGMQPAERVGDLPIGRRVHRTTPGPLRGSADTEIRRAFICATLFAGSPDTTSCFTGLLGGTFSVRSV